MYRFLLMLVSFMSISTSLLSYNAPLISLRTYDDFVNITHKWNKDFHAARVEFKSFPELINQNLLDLSETIEGLRDVAGSKTQYTGKKLPDFVLSSMRNGLKDYSEQLQAIKESIAEKIESVGAEKAGFFSKKTEKIAALGKLNAFVDNLLKLVQDWSQELENLKKDDQGPSAKTEKRISY